jgi:hypothetical protein
LDKKAKQRSGAMRVLLFAQRASGLVITTAALMALVLSLVPRVLIILHTSTSSAGSVDSSTVNPNVKKKKDRHHSSDKVPKLVTLPLRTPSSAKNNHHPPTNNDGTAHPQRHRSLSNSSTRHATATTGKAQQLDALYQGYGTHYVDLWCGTPPQRQTLIVVTGVSPGASGFPCSECTTCSYHHVDDLFQEGNSRTFQSLECDDCLNGHCTSGGDKCMVGMSYPEGSSWRGFEVKDKCYIGGPHTKPLLIENDGGTDDLDPNHASFFAFDLIFSCQTKITGLFDSQLADGILSMDNSPGSFWWQMHDAGQMPERKFTLCFQTQVSETTTATTTGPDRKGTPAGAMTLGGVDARLHTTDMIMSVLDTKVSAASYALQVRKIHVRPGGGGDSAKSTDPTLELRTLALSDNSLIDEATLLDSGYTDTYLNTDIFAEFVVTYKDLTGDTYTNFPKSMSEEEYNLLPTILFQLVGDVEYNTAVLNRRGTERGVVGLATAELDPEHPLDVIVAFPPSHYLELTTGGRYVARIYDAADISETRTTLGSNFMMGHDILFDLDDERLGWAESSCNYQELVGEYLDGVFGDLPDESDAGGGSDSIYDNDDDILIVPIPATTVVDPSSSSGSGGFCHSRFCKSTLLFVLVIGVMVFTVLRSQNYRGRGSRGGGRGGVAGLYSDLPTELELTDRDEHEMTFYRPPSAE